MICHLIRFCTEAVERPVYERNVFQLLLKAKVQWVTSLFDLTFAQPKLRSKSEVSAQQKAKS